MNWLRDLPMGRVVGVVVGIVVGAGWGWGVPVTVRVVEEGGGRPVSGAVVERLGEAVAFDRADERAGGDAGGEAARVGVTDAGGEVRLDCDPGERRAYLVTAEGKGSRVFGFWGCVPPTYRVALGKPTGTWRGRIVGRSGEPVAGAAVRVQVGDWGFLEPVGFSLKWGVMSYGIDGRTDSEGRFAVPAVGEGQVDVVRVREGDVWRSVERVDKGQASEPGALADGSFVGRVGSGARTGVSGPAATRPAASDPTLTIHLRVVDAATGRPVERVRVTPGGSIAPNQFFRTLPGSALELPGEGITWSFYDAAWAYCLRVEAEGYATAPTRVVKASERRAEVELRLRRAEPVALKVRTPAGKPAAGAEAYIATPTVELDMPAGASAQSQDVRPFAVAGEDGVLRFVPPAEPYRLAVRQASGSAEVACTEVAGKGEVVLTPWASVSVQIGGAGHPVPRAYVQPQSAYSQELHCPIDWSGSYQCDAAGRVEIPRWPAGNFMLTATTSAGAGVGWQYLEVQRKLKPGEHLDLSLVAGRTSVRGSLVEVPGYKWSQMWMQLVGPAMELPADVDRLPTGRERRAAVMRAAKSVPESYSKETAVNTVGVKVGGDGTIAIAGLAPGTYELAGAGVPAGSGGASSGAAPEIDWYFSVPASGPAVIDLGSVTPSDRPGLAIGQAVPDLEGKTVDGKAFSLRGNRGHYVLLDFWGTWCGFCIAEEPTLKDAYEGWGRDGRLVMVSASVDDTVEAVREHVAKNGLGWAQVVLGPREKTDVPQRFGVEGYPEIMLISPEGKLVESGLRGVRVREALMKYMGPPSPPGGEGK